MVSLAQLSSDVLSLILGLADLDITSLRLWRCGCRSLNAKLARSVTELDLRPVIADELLLPRMLLDLRRLRKLSLYALKINPKKPKFWSRTMERLPEWLEVLEISSESVIHAFLNYAPGWPDYKTLLVETHYDRGLSSCWDIGAKFPRLESLKIEEILETSPNPSSFTLFGLLPALPSTLTVFSTGNMNLPYEAPFNALLPRSLTLLDSHLTMESASADPDAFSEDWSLMPPGLTRIESLVDLTTVCDYTGSADWLPKAVRHVQIPICSHALDLPSHIESLSVTLCTEDIGGHQITSDWARNLPPKLTSLSSSLSAWNPDPDLIGLMPRSLTHFDVGMICSNSWRTHFGYDPVNEELWHENQLASHLWPPRLESASVSLQSVPAMIGVLPPTIKTLTVDLCLIDKDEFPSNLLPPQLTTLHFKVMRSPLNASKGFPESLTDVSFSIHDDGHLKPQTISNLPSSVTHLSVHSDTRYGYGVHRMPPWILPLHLRLLEIHVFKIEWIKDLPPTLEHFAIDRLSSKNPPHFHFETVETPILLDFSKFPHHLNLLHLGETDTLFKVIPSSFASLPSLTSLQFPFGVLVPSSTLRYLPQSMSHLSLLGFKEESEGDLAFIPPRIYYLNLGAVKYDKPIIAENWPIYALESIPPEREETRRLIKKRIIQRS